MTVGTARKYNPGFLTDDELAASFCIRTNEFESMVEMLRDCGQRRRWQSVRKLCADSAEAMHWAALSKFRRR